MLLGLQVLEEDKMISQEMLWAQYFTESYLGFKPNSLIDQIAKAIIYRPDLFRTLVLNLSQSDMSYEYNPTIGASSMLPFNLIIDFRFNKGEVIITRLGETQLFSTSEFMRLLELIDKIYTEILPLGSVIQINREKLPKDALEDFMEEMPIYVLITGQRVSVENKFYLDYTGYFWPKGLIQNQETLVISDDMIESVLFRGLEKNDIQEQHILNLRRQLLAKDLDSYTFHNYQMEARQ